MEGPVKDVEAGADSKAEKIEKDDKDETALDAEKELTTAITTENAAAETDPSKEEGEAEEVKRMKGPVKDVEADNNDKEDKIEDPSKDEGEAEEGNRSVASKSKFSKLQSLIFGSLQKFFKSQVR